MASLWTHISDTVQEVDQKINTGTTSAKSYTNVDKIRKCCS